MELSFLVDDRDSDSELVVVSGLIDESLNQCTRVLLTCASPRSDIDPDQLIGKRASVRLTESGAEKHANRFDGFIDCFRHVAAPPGSLPAYSYEIVMRSHLWQTGYAFGSWVYRGKSVLEIAEEVLGRHNMFKNMDFYYKLIKESAYPAEAQIIQFNTSDLDFLSHQLAANGINYFMAAPSSPDEPEYLALCDHFTFFQNCYDDPVAFHPQGDFFTDRSFVSSFKLNKRVMPAKVTLQGYESGNPHKAASASREIDQEGTTELRFFMGLPDRNQSDRVAKIRQEEIVSRRQEGQGKSNLFRFRSGAKFSLDPDPLQKPGQKYVLTKVRHSFYRGVGYALADSGASPVYDNTFSFVLDETPIRPQFITHWMTNTPNH